MTISVKALKIYSMKSMPDLTSKLEQSYSNEELQEALEMFEKAKKHNDSIHIHHIQIIEIKQK